MNVSILTQAEIDALLEIDPEPLTFPIFALTKKLDEWDIVRFDEEYISQTYPDFNLGNYVLKSSKYDYDRFVSDIQSHGSFEIVAIDYSLNTLCRATALKIEDRKLYNGIEEFFSKFSEDNPERIV